MQTHEIENHSVYLSISMSKMKNRKQKERKVLGSTYFNCALQVPRKIYLYRHNLYSRQSIKKYIYVDNIKVKFALFLT